MELRFGDGASPWIITVEAVRDGGTACVQLDVPAGVGWHEWLERHGRLPLPPYIIRPGALPDAMDEEGYQTHYARVPGAVAAPTAGLHFTPELDARLKAAGIGLAALTLHVGPGTFKPITAEDLSGHEMEAEYYEIPPLTLHAVAETRRLGGRVIAVGTTTARALESAASAGFAMPSTPRPPASPGPEGGGAAASGLTTLFIRPGHIWRVVDGIMTNFHLPRTTLLAMISAMAGRERLLAAYDHALRSGYRFYSYGDAMLVLPDADVGFH